MPEPRCKHNIREEGHTVRMHHQRVADDCEEVWLECCVCNQATEPCEAPYWQQVEDLAKMEWLDGNYGHGSGVGSHD